jgi:hypothetical protein
LALNKLIHIINPILLPKEAELKKAQEITFESMERALAYCKRNQDVTIAMTGFEEDYTVFPGNFKSLSPLVRSMSQLFPDVKGKKLPFIEDILGKVFEIEELADEDFIIYTNIDIALQPYFYDAIFEYIEKGKDALIINRRRISKNYFHGTLTEMYTELGYSHPGFDCFVFKLKALKKFYLQNICIGIPFLEVTLLHNILSFAETPLFVPDKHLTFHIGLDVLPSHFKPYYRHNRRTFFKEIEPKLKSKYSLQKFPYAESGPLFRALRWMLNPGIFTRNYLELEAKSAREKAKNFLNEWRWRFLQR